MKIFTINDVVFNKHYNTIGIVLDIFYDEDIRTDMDGVVYGEDCIKVNTRKDLEEHLANGVKIAPSTMDRINTENLLF